MNINIQVFYICLSYLQKKCILHFVKSLWISSQRSFRYIYENVYIDVYTQVSLCIYKRDLYLDKSLWIPRYKSFRYMYENICTYFVFRYTYEETYVNIRYASFVFWKNMYIADIVSFIGLFYKRDLSFLGAYYYIAICEVSLDIKLQVMWGGYDHTNSSKLLKMIGLFCRIQSLLQGSFTKETYHFQEPTTILQFVKSLWISKYTSFRYLLVGPLKLQVSFAKQPYKRDYILQKKPIIFRSLLLYCNL